MDGSPPSAPRSGTGTPERRLGRTYHRRPTARKALGVAALLGAALATVARLRPSRLEVVGGSMRPALEPGEWAIAVRPVNVRRGDVVVVEHPDRAAFELVKRVVAVGGELAPDGRTLDADAIWVEGDARGGSTDSRSFGPIPRDAVRARVVLVYPPVDRIRPVRRDRGPGQDVGGSSETRPTVSP